MTREDFLDLLPKLAKDYQPAPGAIDRIKDVSLLMIVGPSGVGKTVVIDRLGLAPILNFTTRMPRPGERDGEDFSFLKNYDDVVKEVKNGEFVQMVVGVNGDLYGTKESSYPKSGLTAMPVLADAVPVFRKLGFKDTISAFIAPPSFEEWQRRMNIHPLTEEQRAKRMAEAKRSLTFALDDKEVHLILNDDLDEAVNQTKALLNGQVNKSREDQARHAAQNILNELD